jgi:hypothetical protein
MHCLRLAKREHPPVTYARDHFSPTIDAMAARRRGPGLTKTSRAGWLRRRDIQLWEASDYRWRELFEAADVMSEGATRDEPDGPVYYGSTSVILPLQSRGGLVPDDEHERIVRALGADPHARIRAVRIAYLEAQLRAGGPIGQLSADVVPRVDTRGVRLDIEVEARVLHRVARTTRRRRGRS